MCVAVYEQQQVVSPNRNVNLPNVVSGSFRFVKEFRPTPHNALEEQGLGRRFFWRLDQREPFTSDRAFHHGRHCHRIHHHPRQSAPLVSLH